MSMQTGEITTYSNQMLQKSNSGLPAKTEESFLEKFDYHFLEDVQPEEIEDVGPLPYDNDQNTMLANETTKKLTDTISRVDLKSNDIDKLEEVEPYQKLEEVYPLPASNLAKEKGSILEITG